MNSLQKLFMDYKGKAKTLIETGTYNGVGVSTAIKAGYNFIHSFEIVDELAKIATKKFQSNRSIKIYPVSSANIAFRDLVLSCTEPCVFWLDAHKMGGGGKIPEDYPLIAELEAIGNSKYCHTVLMDDFRLFERYGVSIDDVKKHLTKDEIECTITKETIREKYPKDVLCFKPTEM